MLTTSFLNGALGGNNLDVTGFGQLLLLSVISVFQIILLWSLTSFSLDIPGWLHQMSCLI
jgi:hypothetical protein